jgi:DNA-binding NarL/FixJ family response regulator
VNEPLRIIIVDDEPLARDSIRVLLEHEAGVRVVGEASGVDAAALIARTRPDIMFSATPGPALPCTVMLACMFMPPR